MGYERWATQSNFRESKKRKYEYMQRDEVARRCHQQAGLEASVLGFQNILMQEAVGEERLFRCCSGGTRHGSGRCEDGKKAACWWRSHIATSHIAITKLTMRSAAR